MKDGSVVPFLKALYGDNISLIFVSLLRGMILPSQGHELFVADFSRIEVAVLWWLSENKPGLKILKAGMDPYKYMAAANTGKNYLDIPDEGDERQLGKAQILGAGFGMGATKFQKTAWDMYRLKLSEEQSKTAIDNYRRIHSAVPILWKACENAAINAVESGEIFFAGYCQFFKKDKFLWVELPSGRRLAYKDPQISWRESEYGPRKTLELWGVNSKTKKWALERTWGGILTENIVQAVARDLLMQGILRLEKAGYKVLLTVHDEVLCEKPLGTGDLKEFTRILCQDPKWGNGIPIEAKGWKGPRYRK